MVKYYSDMWFLHTSRLLRHQWSQKNQKRLKKIFEGQGHNEKFDFLTILSPWLGSYGVNLMGKAVDLSLKAIKVT